MKSRKNSNKQFWRTLSICLFILLLVGAFFALRRIDLEELEYHRTTDLADYGNYTGTAKDDYVQSFVDSFFPEEIEGSYEDITFVYCVEGADTYGFEVYLEFTISNPDEFEDYIQNIGHTDKWQKFSFDPRFMECEIRDGFSLTHEEPEENYPDCNIESASIKKILYSNDDQRIIYWALGVYDGGFADTSHFNAFFDRFEIDPYLYTQQAYSPTNELFEP